MQKALVVEADPPLASCLAAFLARHAFEIDTAAGPDDALERLRADRRFGLALLDTRLGGFALCETIRADLALRRVRVVVTGPRGRKAMALKARALGADAYLSKPFTPGELLAAIGAVEVPA